MKLSLLLSTLILVCACRPSSNLAPQVQASPAISVERWTFEALWQRAQELDESYRARGQLLTRDDLLPHLKEVYLRRYTILRDSDASEGVDSSDPTDGRVIAFGEDASLILAWTRDSSTLQVAQHRGTHLELRELRFPAATTEALTVTAANPEECGGSACHGDHRDPHYRWGEYPHWPKAHGGDEDYVGPGDEERRLAKLLDAEHPAFASLRKPARYPTSLGTFRIGRPRGGVDSVRAGEKSGASYQYRPNTFLTLALARLHAEQMFHHLRRNGALYARLRSSLLYVMSRCDSLGDRESTRINAWLAALHAEHHRPGPPPQIDVGANDRRWMPWFTLLGTAPERWELADESPEPLREYHQGHLFNAGFTRVAYIVGAHVWEDAVRSRHRWREFDLRGNLRQVEATLLGRIVYSDPFALARQVAILDQLGRFVAVDPRPFLEPLRGPAFALRKQLLCAELAVDIVGRLP